MIHPTDLPGRAFAAVFAAIKSVRPRRPIHPQGALYTGTINLTGADTGINWLDTPRNAPVTARLSRSIGLPVSWPDIIGLAVRVETEHHPADILLASTGWRMPGRFALTVARTAGGATLTSLMPYRGRRGPVLLGARTRGTDPGAPGRLNDAEWRLELFHATPAGPWARLGELALEPLHRDTDLRFDPLLNLLPGASTYEWTRRLREPSYRRARR